MIRKAAQTVPSLSPRLADLFDAMNDTVRELTGGKEPIEGKSKSDSALIVQQYQLHNDVRLEVNAYADHIVFQAINGEKIKVDTLLTLKDAPSENVVHLFATNNTADETPVAFPVGMMSSALPSGEKTAFSKLVNIALKTYIDLDSKPKLT